MMIRPRRDPGPLHSAASFFQALAKMAAVVALLFVMATPAAAILQKGQPAPPIDVKSTSGQHITLANYRGRVLLVDFFATWCLPCRDIVAHLNELKAKHGKQGLEILGLHVEEESPALKTFMAERKVSYPVAVASEDLQTEYGLRSVPTIYIIDKKGVVAGKYMGYSDAIRNAIDSSIKRLLAE